MVLPSDARGLQEQQLGSRRRPPGSDEPEPIASASATLTANGGATLADLEKRFTVTTGADRAFDFLSDPVHLPEYVSTMRLEDSTAVDGALDVDADLGERGGAREAGFVADRATRRITWGRPGGPYGGSIQITPETTNTAGVTLQLRTSDDTDGAEVARIFDQAVSDIRRALSGR